MDMDPARMAPAIRLLGQVDEEMLLRLLDGLAAAEKGTGPVLLELQTSGGDAEIGRRMALEAKLAARRLGPARPLLFLGKTAVYSAGVTLMAGFPRDRRFLSADAVLLIHERRLEGSVQVSGPLRAARQLAQQVLAQIEVGMRLEEEGFRDLVEGSRVTLDEIRERAASTCYLHAAEAQRMGLVADLV